MRRIVTAITLFATFALLGPLLTTAGATTPGWPAGAIYTTDLVAGQTVDAGDVLVKYDATHIYVKVVGDGWCFTSLHVQPGPTWPLTKTGNPIPGKFVLNLSYDPCEDDSGWLTLDKPSGWNGTVAVQADVWELASQTTLTIVSDHTKDVAAPAPTVVADSTYWAGIDCAALMAASPAAEWIWNAVQAPNPPADPGYTRVDITRAFTVPGLPVSGSLTTTTDDRYSASLNGALVGADSTNTWPTCETYPLAPNSGANTLSFAAYNTYNADPAWSTWNPAGLIYKATVTYYAHSEGAWAKGPAFPNASNWSTYVSLPTGQAIYHSDGYSCASGAADTSGAVLGAVTITKVGGNVVVTGSLTGALASTTYSIWVNQNPGACPLGAPNGGTVTTDGDGYAKISVSVPFVVGATTAWISAITPPDTGATQVLRSTAAVI